MLPKFQSDDQSVNLMQSSWKQDLDPLLNAPLSNAIILSNIPLTSGSNIINHKLGRTLQGWFVVRQRGAASIYDNQNNNMLPSNTLILISSSGVNVDLAVF